MQRVEFSQDGQRWRGVFPVDGIADSREEHYELAIDGELGERGLTLRASDSMNNVATIHVAASAPTIETPALRRTSPPPRRWQPRTLVTIVALERDSLPRRTLEG